MRSDAHFEMPCAERGRFAAELEKCESKHVFFNERITGDNAGLMKSVLECQLEFPSDSLVSHKSRLARNQCGLCAKKYQ